MLRRQRMTMTELELRAVPTVFTVTNLAGTARPTAEGGGKVECPEWHLIRPNSLL